MDILIQPAERGVERGAPAGELVDQSLEPADALRGAAAQRLVDAGRLGGINEHPEPAGGGRFVQDLRAVGGPNSPQHPGRQGPVDLERTRQGRRPGAGADNLLNNGQERFSQLLRDRPGAA
jgi:hypothetical protein